MTYKTIDYTTQDSILTLTLSRPDHLNSFTIEMSHELIDAFNRASNDDAVGAIVVTGAGRAFCAGMDLTSAGNVFGLNMLNKSANSNGLLIAGVADMHINLES